MRPFQTEVSGVEDTKDWVERAAGGLSSAPWPLWEWSALKVLASCTQLLMGIRAPEAQGLGAGQAKRSRDAVTKKEDTP